MTFFYKKGFPFIWFALLALATIASAADVVTGKNSALTLLWPSAMMILGYVLFKALAFDLADEVSDDGTHLLVRRGSDFDRIPIADIGDVKEPVYFRNPRRVTLTLVKPSKFGREITFSPASDFSLNPFGRTQLLAEDLAKRAAAARGERAG